MRAEVYGELAKANISPSMQEIQIATMLRLAMAIEVVEGKIVIECVFKSQNSAEWLKNAIKETYKIDCQLRKTPQGSSGFMFCLHVDGASAKRLIVASRLLDRKTKRIVSGFPAFATIPLLPAATAMWRGAIMARGELNPEKKTGAKVYCSLPELAEELKKSASILGVEVRINTRGRRKSVEVTPANQTVKLLNLLGARDWAIKVCDIYAQKDDIKHVISQLYEANKERSSNASRNACEKIKKAIEVLDGTPVPVNLMKAGKLRLKYPNATLSELGRLSDPPISKDALTGRIRRLYKLAVDRQGRQSGPVNPNQSL